MYIFIKTGRGKKKNKTKTNVAETITEVRKLPEAIPKEN